MEVVGLPQRGGCLCGAVRYGLGAAPLLAYACHCHDRQTRSGSAFALGQDWMASAPRFSAL